MVNALLNTCLKTAHQPLLFLAVGLRIQRYHRILFAIVILLLDIYTLYQDCHLKSEVTLLKYGQCSGLVASDFVIVKLLLLTADPLASILYKGEGEACNPKSLHILPRIERGANLSWNLRDIGLNTQISNLPRNRDPRARGAYVMRQISWLSLHAIRLLVIWWPSVHFQLHKTWMRNEPPAATMLENVFRRVFFTFVVGFTTISIIDGVYILSAIVAVGSGYSDPASWPPCFGRLRDATSVRRFWKYTWHQNYQIPFTMMSSFIVNDLLRIPPRSRFSSPTRLIVAFIISGSMHAVGDYGMFRGTQWFSFRFFAVQPFAIFAESAVMSLFDRQRGVLGGVGGSILGYIWVVAWLTATVPEFGRPFLAAIT